MHIIQLQFSTATLFDMKIRSIDQHILSTDNRVEVWEASGDELHAPQGDPVPPSELARRSASEGWDVVHVYGPVPRTPSVLRGLRAPYVAPSDPAPSLLPWRRTPLPAARVGASEFATVREAVAPRFFESVARSSGAPEGAPKRIGGFAGPRPRKEAIAAVASRVIRFREDIEWRFFEEPPDPEDLDELDLWIDATPHEDDADGFTAEALVRRRVVVASRTPLNAWRLDGGRAGFLVPPDDPNEMAHAILGALFKSEISEPRRRVTAASRERFRPELRRDELLRLYGAVSR
ncbi:MAG: hypothetical protein WBX15_03695 [Thermoanaerobaculia bacterium]